MDISLCQPLVFIGYRLVIVTKFARKAKKELHGDVNFLCKKNIKTVLSHMGWYLFHDLPFYWGIFF